MSDVSITIRVRGEQAAAELDKVAKKAKDAQINFNLFQQTTDRASAAFGSFVGNLGASAVSKAFSLVASGFASAVRSTIEFETALVGVGKTTGLAGSELDDFGAEAEKLARKLPLSSRELLNLAQTAGQLGVRGSDSLLKFADTAARLASATDLSAEAAITGLTRIIRLTGESDENVDRLGASLVALGNNFNATEAQILGVATALSQSTAGFNIGADEILGFSTAIAEAGLGAEKSATAIGGILTDIAKAFSSGSDAAKNFASATGLSLEEVSTLISTDAGKALDLFIGSLSDVADNTIELTKRLGELGVQEKREIQVIQSLVQLRETQSRALKTSAEGFRENTALQEESERAFETLGAELAKATNSITELSKVLLQESGLVDALRFAAKQTQLITGFWSDYFRATDNARVASKDLATEINTLGKEIGVTLDQFNPNDIESIATANDKVLQKYKEINAEINKLRSADDARLLRFNDSEVARLEQLREKAADALGALRQQEQILTQTQDEEQKARLANQKINNEEELSIAREKKELQRLLDEEFSTSNIEFIQENLGLQEALEVASNAKRLAEKGKFEDAVLALQRARLKAEETAQREKEKRDEQAARAQLQLDEQVGQQRVNLAANLGAAINAAAGKQTAVGFLLQKAAAVAQVIVSSAQAEAAALAPPPLGLGPVAGNALVPLIKANRNLQLATIAATAIQGFESGGIVPGSSFSGDRVLARVNSGEMILNRQQQAALFQQANGEGSGGSREVVVNTTIQLDGETIGRAVSRQVADGLRLGEAL